MFCLQFSSNTQGIKQQKSSVNLNKTSQFATHKNTNKTPQCIYFEKKLKSSHLKVN